MKKIYLTAAAVFAFGFANAQDVNESSVGFKNGDVLLGGSFNISSKKYSENENFKENNFTIAPKISFFVTDNIALGLGLGLGSKKTVKLEGDNEVKINTTSRTAFGRYYTAPASKFSIFGQLLVKWDTVNFDAYKENSFGFELAPGVNYFLNKHFALEATWGTLSYSTSKKGIPFAKSSNAFELGLNLDDINLGIVYKF
jgi:hypothetical protein